MTGFADLRIFEKDGKCCFQVRLQPRASESKVVGVYNGTLKIRLTAPPVENRANLQLIEFLAKILHLKKGQISIQSGLRSRSKTVAVRGLSEEKVLALLTPYLV